MSVSCHSCGKNLSFSLGEKISFSEECDHCADDIHNCRMCKFYDSQSYNECKEPSAERIVEKEKRNFCEYFSLIGTSKDDDKENAAISAAEALFKN